MNEALCAFYESMYNYTLSRWLGATTAAAQQHWEERSNWWMSKYFDNTGIKIFYK